MSPSGEPLHLLIDKSIDKVSTQFFHISANMSLQLLLRKSYFGKRYGPKMKAGSQYTANMLQPVIDCCQIEIFPIFCSDLHQPSPLRQLHRPATSVNEP